MCKIINFLPILALILCAVSPSYGIVVGDFEDDTLDGWWSDDGTLSQSAIGATVGDWAMQSDLVGLVPPDDSWRMAAMMDAKAHRPTLGLEGSTISADVTVSSTDGTDASVEIIINAQDDDPNSPNNNVGWNAMGSRGLPIDGTTTSYVWTIDAALADKIAASDDAISYFELVIATWADANSLSVNVDNVQINEPPTEAVIGNFEDATLDGWYAGGDATLSQEGTVGVTLDDSSMKIVAPGRRQTVSILDAKPWITLMGTGVRISADITVIESDIIGDDSLEAEMIINGQGDNGYTVGWNELGFQDLVLDGQPHTHTWDISPALTAAIAAADQSIGWFEIFFDTDNDATGSTTEVTLYVDNIRLFQPEILPCEGPFGIVVGDFETDVDGWWVNPEDCDISQTSTGATTGSGALQIDDPGDGGDTWRVGARLDAKPYLSILGSAGAKITMDVTVSSEDMPNWWLYVGMVINGENGNGYVIGWRDMGQQEVLVTDSRETVTLTWDLPEQLIADIALADSGIGWFELVITKNSDPGVFFVDNIQVYPRPDPVSYPYGNLIGNFETGLDGWVQWDATTFEQSEIGATRDCTALKIVAPIGYIGNIALEGGAYYDMFATGAKITADITVFPGDVSGTWGGMQMLINTENQGWVGLEPWVEPIIADGKPHTYTWAPSDALRTEMASEGSPGGWFQLVFLTNNDSPTTTFYIDNIWIYLDAKATNPSPADGATDVERLITASWMPGAGAVEHDVFLSTNQTALSEVDRDNLGSYPDVMYFNTLDASVDFPKLDLTTLYWWRVDEVEDSNDIVTGDTWSFTVANSILIDNFESYVDTADLIATWADSNSLSTDVAHLGDQAMLLNADNTKSPFYSETTIALSEDLKDLTQLGMSALELYFRGDPNNSPELMYVRVVNSADDVGVMVYPGDPGDIELEQWRVWRITLDDFGIDLTDVATVSIGFGNRENPSAGDIIEAAYIDDIRLIPRDCVLSARTAAFVALDYAPAGNPAGDCVIDAQELEVMVNDWLQSDDFIPTSNPGTTGLVAYYPLNDPSILGDPNIIDASGSGHDGTVIGVVSLVTGHDGTGYAIEFDGLGGGYVDLGTWDPTDGTGALTVAAWMKWAGPNDGWQGVVAKRDAWSDTDTHWYIELNNTSGNIGFARFDSYPWFGDYNIPLEGEWMHLAVTFDGTNTNMYIRGKQVGDTSTEFSLGPKADAQLNIGSVDGGGNPFNGAIDEVYLYNRALSASEVAYLADVTPTDNELYYSIVSDAEIYDSEAEGSRRVNLSDFAMIAEVWLVEQLWP
jgi:hypothetical protein